MNLENKKVSWMLKDVYPQWEVKMQLSIPSNLWLENIFINSLSWMLKMWYMKWWRNWSYKSIELRRQCNAGGGEHVGGGGSSQPLLLQSPLVSAVIMKTHPAAFLLHQLQPWNINRHVPRCSVVLLSSRSLALFKIAARPWNGPWNLKQILLQHLLLFVFLASKSNKWAL